MNLMDVFTDAYRTVKRSRREPQWDDRLIDDLGIDSLDAIDMLTLMEGRLGDQFELDRVSENLADVVTVGQLIERITDVMSPMNPAKAAG